MRKLLLASVAALGVAGVAQAQTQVVTAPTAPGVSGPFANKQPTPAPGQIAVRLNGALNTYFGFAATGDAHQPGEKLDNFGIRSYIRLYPGFDGVAANGLKYGVVAEIRQDNGKPAQANPTTSTAMERSHLYWRRAYGYVGGDSWGKIQFGSGDGPISSMGGIGHFYNIGTGNHCGDAPVYAASLATWPFMACSGAMYTTNSVAYYSPQFAGFDFGISYEPNTGNLSAANECSSGATTGCDQLSTTNGADVNRRRNLLDMALRYRGSFNGVGIAAVGGYLFSGKVNDSQAWTAMRDYDGLSVGYGGATISFANFSVGGAVQGGDQNGTGLKRDSARGQFAWVVGATYTMGPAQLGATYFESKSSGSWTPDSPGYASRTRTDRGVEVALNYGIAPGLSATLEYMWGDSKQPGIDITPGSRTGDVITWQALVGGMHLKW